MDLTVIIPIYNRGRMLAQALESLRWQTYKDFVVIVCDDASPENLKEVVDKFTDLKIEYHYYKANAGQFGNAMRGVEICQTPFMKFLYSDDLLFPTALEKQVKALQEVPNAAVCLGEYIEFEEFSAQKKISLYKSIFPYIPEPRTDKQWARLEEYSGFIPSACMYRAELFRYLGGFNAALPGIGDWEIYVALSYKYPVVATNEPVCAMRMHSDQVTKKCGVNSDAIYIKDVFWMTSNANPYRERLGIPLSQQFFLRLDQCWANLRIALSSNQKLFFLKKWLEIVTSNKMLLPFIFAFPWFVTIKFLRKPKVQTRASNNLNMEKYKDNICSILFNEKSVSYQIK
jgi:glycosyltransferase involved in cell wall biosynthesis